MLLQAIGVILVLVSFLLILNFPPVPTPWASQDYKAYAERVYAKMGVSAKFVRKRVWVPFAMMSIGLLLLF